MNASKRSVGFIVKAIGRRLVGPACLLFATGCGAAADEMGAEPWGEVEKVGELGEAITGGWTTPTLLNGWQNYNSTEAPAVGVVNGTVRFRGALKGPNATSTCAFVLPAAFRSYFTSGGSQAVGADQLWMRAVLANSVGGAIFFEPDVFAGLSPTKNCIHVVQDGVSGVGAAAKIFASLDGITFDRTMDNSTVLEIAPGWSSLYTYRQQGQAGAYVKLVDGFVRFQGALTDGGPGGTTRLFTLPAQFRPGQAVYVPVNLCSGTGQKYGRLNIYTNGEVHVQGDFAASRCLVSLEGASYSLATGGTTLTLLNGWVPYSARAVKARVNGGVVRLEGAVKNGTSTTIAVLPSNMRPSRTVYLASDSWAAAQGRIYVTSAGNVVVQYPALSTASGFTSLDGLSFSF